MARISVVVPIFDVERYLEACLHSVARQTVEDLEVLMVDDGSTDGSAAIAARFAERDPRFRLIRQPNGGLGQARNTGTDAATGEYLAFLDSDDVLPSNAYELLLGALERSGSDFAAGNVHRLTDAGTSQAPFVAKAFARTRLRTHVTRFRPLLSDRTAWNKLWRRSFWDEHGLRFPEGVVHEDIPVVLPAHVRARSVDVVAAPVYRYRIRPGDDRSITQRRLERRVMLDRLAAVESVRAFLASSAPRRVGRWYDERLVADDLRLHLDLLADADDAYRELFVDRANALLDTAAGDVFDGLAALDRLKWHLLRRRLVPELLEVLRFQASPLPRPRPVRRRGRWYGAYPFSDDARLAIPASVYRLNRSDPELALTPHLDGIRREGGVLHVSGRACIDALGAAEPGTQRVALHALRPGRLQAVRLRLSPVRLATRAARRDGRPDRCWAGFEATLDPRALRRGGRWVDGTWELSAAASIGLLRRRRSRFVVEDPRVARAVDLPAEPGVSVRAVATPEGSLTIQVRRTWAALRAHRLDGPLLVLEGALALPGAREASLELRRVEDGLTLAAPLELVERGAPHAFRTAVALADVHAAAAPVHGDGGYRVWELRIVAGTVRLPVALPDDVAAASWPTAVGETSLLRTTRGDAALVDRRTGVPAGAPSEPHGELALP